MQRNAEALETAVTGLIQMVVIQLTSDDDPYVIFETLNARGTPLLESDLIKNYVMSRASQSETIGQMDIWGDLDEDWWGEEVTQGRLIRPRKDMLLNYWLAMRTGSDVRADRVFRTFSSDADTYPIHSVMEDVKRDLGNYRRFEEGPRSPEEEKFHLRVNDVMGIGAITPALLLLLSLPPETRAVSLRAMESFLVRRMLCRGDATKDYNRLTLDLIQELRTNGADNAGSTVVDYLRRQEAYTREWPKYDALENALCTRTLYRVLNQKRLRMVLEGIEEHLLSESMAENISLSQNLEIEHVMPRSWEENWPLPQGTEIEEATGNRNSIIHTIGNLTLTTGRVNKALSNAAWGNKRNTLWEHSNLFLNKTLLSESEGKEWNEEFIQARSKRMAKLVAEIWPGPDSPIWD